MSGLLPFLPIFVVNSQNQKRQGGREQGRKLRRSFLLRPSKSALEGDALSSSAGSLYHLSKGRGFIPMFRSRCANGAELAPPAPLPPAFSRRTVLGLAHHTK
jgi:hypothetical protein